MPTRRPGLPKKQPVSEAARPVSKPEQSPAAASEPPNDNIDDKTTVRVVDKRWWARESNSTTHETEDSKSDKPAYVEELERKVADLERELADRDVTLTEYAQKYKDATRDFDQTRDRLRRELAKDVDREMRGVLSSFLEIIDNLDRAIAAAAHEAEDGNAMLKGVQLVRGQFLATFGRYGVKQLDAAGQLFNPNFHDALSTVSVTDQSQDNLIVTVVKPGYLVNDDVLRPASVTVGKLAVKG